MVRFINTLMKPYIIYKHTCPEGKSYIGVTQDLDARNKSHQRIRKGAKLRAFEEAILKFGWDNFTHTILCTTTSDNVKQLERQYILQYNTRTPHGYNMRGGGGGMIFNQQPRQPKPIAAPVRTIAAPNGFIHALIEIGVLKRSGRISPKAREILACEPRYIQYILEYTKNLKYNADILTRLHCVMKGITEQPVCSCGSILRMRMTGRYAYTFPTHCSNKCTSNDKSVIEKRKSTNIEKYGAPTPLLKSDIAR